jgi:hypothetical protein
VAAQERSVQLQPASSEVVLRGTGDRYLSGISALGAEAKGVATMQRDQTNTDGSFYLDAVLPSVYILAAIDHEGAVTWRDPTMLLRYLIEGIAVDIAHGAALRLGVEAQNPRSTTPSLAEPKFVLDSSSPLHSGEMAEWLKAHAWKACIPQGIQGSNPCLSATPLELTSWKPGYTNSYR